jgi:hypothetical protein
MVSVGFGSLTGLRIASAVRLGRLGSRERLGRDCGGIGLCVFWIVRTLDRDCFRPTEVTHVHATEQSWESGMGQMAP